MSELQTTLDWFRPERLDAAEQRRVAQHLHDVRPFGVVGQGSRNETFYRTLTVRSASRFDVPGLQPWGVVETVELGGVVVPPELVSGADLPRLPVPLRKLAARVGPTRARFLAAQAQSEARPAVVRLRKRFLNAAVADARLHRQLEEWTPVPER